MPRPRRPARRGRLHLPASLGLAALLGAFIPPADLAGRERHATAPSLVPEEAQMPPLAEAMARLAAESAEAACWVRRLDQTLPPCAEAWGTAGSRQSGMR